MTPNVSPEEIQDLKTMCSLSKLSPSIDEEVLEACMASVPDKNLSHALHYLESVVEIRKKHFGLDTDRKIRLADIGWHHRVGFKSTHLVSFLSSH
jgi:hypothetical protein